MMRAPPLPLLPGNQINLNVGQTRFHKSHHLEVVEGRHYIVDREPPGIGGLPSFHLRDDFPSLYPRCETIDIPPWLAYDKMVLSFDAYLQDQMAELMGYNYIIRKCKVYFFLEDGSIKVVEKKNPNSSYPHAGCLISRQRIRYPKEGNDGFYDVLDLNVGVSVELCGRMFHLTDCDPFTRTFLNRLGVPVPDPLPQPDDPFEQLRKLESEAKKKTKEGKKKKTLDEYLSTDSRILSFDAYWDDRNRAFGYVHLLKVFYYLADDTMEIKDVTEKEKSFTIVKKGKLAKDERLELGVGLGVEENLLNVIGCGLGEKCRSLVDPLALGLEAKEFYMDRDLAIGAVLNAYGKKVVICNCDQFTQHYYRVKFGIDSFTPLERPLTTEEEELQRPELSEELPPYNGFGTYEDSAINCISITPFTIVKSYKRFYEKDREGYDSRILRFSAKLVSNYKRDDKRNFIICYYVVDDTVCVYETSKDTADSMSSAMMARRKMYRPGQEVYASKEPDWYSHDDFFLGNQLTLENHTFILTGADEYAFKYMEMHSNEFPKSNITLIMSKIRDKVRPIYKSFAGKFFTKDGTPPVSYHILRNALKEVFNDEITEQEIITVSRKYNVAMKREKFSLETLRRCTHDELKRRIFEEFERLHEALVARDPEHTGAVSKETAYRVLRGARLPIDPNLLNLIIDRFSENEKCEIKYDELMCFLNYKKYPTTPLTPISIPANMSWMNLYQPDNHTQIDYVDVKRFIEELKLEEELKQQSQ